MTVPLGVLAIGAIFSGMVWYNDFFGDRLEKFFHLGGAEAHASAEAAPAEHGAAAPAEHAAPADHAAPAADTAAPEGKHAPAAGEDRMAFMATRARMWHPQLAARSISTPTTTSSTRRMPRRNG